jgi:hypothetical protein
MKSLAAFMDREALLISNGKALNALTLAQEPTLV